MSDIEDDGCGCSSKRSSKRNCGGGNTRNPADIQAATQIFNFTLPNLELDTNQRGVGMLFHRSAGGQQAFLQLRQFSGVFTDDVDVLQWDNLPFAPCNSVTQLIHMNLNGRPIQGLFKYGGRTNAARLYIHAQYSAGQADPRLSLNRRSLASVNAQRRCRRVLFQAGDQLICQGFALQWSPVWDR